MFDKIEQIRIGLNKEDNFDFLYNDHMTFIDVLYVLDKMKLKDLRMIFDCIYNNEIYKTEGKLQSFMIALEEYDKLDLEYNDNIQIINKHKNDDNFVPIIKYLLFPKYNQNEVYKLKHEYSYDSLLEKEDELDWEYNDVVRLLDAECSSNGAITIIDSVKIIHED